MGTGFGALQTCTLLRLGLAASNMCGVQRCQPAHISAGMALALWPPCKWQHVSPSFWCQQTANTSNLQSYIVQEGDDLKFKAQHMQLHGTELSCVRPARHRRHACMLLHRPAQGMQKASIPRGRPNTRWLSR